MNKKNFLYFLLTKVISAFFVFAFLPLYSAYLDPVDFGLVVSVSIVLDLFFSFVDIGAGWTLSTSFYKDPAHLKKITFNLLFFDLAFRLIVGLCLYGLLPFISPFFSLPDNSFTHHIIVILLLSNILSFPLSTGLSYMILAEDGLRFLYINLIGCACYSGCMIFCLLVLHFKASSIALATLAQTVGTGLIYLLYFRSKLAFTLDWTCLRLNAGPSALKTGFSNILNNSDRLVTQRLLSVSTLGLFSFSKQFGAIYDGLDKSFNRVYCTFFFKTFDRQNISEHSKVCNFWLVFNFLLSAGVILFVPTFIHYSTHGKFDSASIFAQFFFVQTFTSSYSSFFKSILVALKKPIFISFTSVSLGLIGIATNLWLVSRFGAIGLSFTAIFISLSILFLNYGYVRAISSWHFSEKPFLFLFLTLILLLSGRFFHSYVFDTIPLLLLSLLYIIFSAFVIHFTGLLMPLRRLLLSWRSPRMDSI